MPAEFGWFFNSAGFFVSVGMRKGDLKRSESPAPFLKLYSLGVISHISFSFMETPRLTASGRQIQRAGVTTKAVACVSAEKEQPSDKSAAPKVRWNDHMRKILIDCYLAELDVNVGADNGLKSQQWNSLTAKFAVDAGVPLTKSQLQNQHADLKKKWGAYSDLLKQSGFGWNASTSTPNCEPRVFISLYLNSTLSFSLS